MFVPVIVGSDKTTVSVGTGDNEFWPVYGSIGNIHNNIRRAHGTGLVLIGFLSIPKGNSFFISCSVAQLIFWQPTRPIRQILNSAGFGANFSIYRYQRCLSRFDQEWKRPKLLNVLMDSFDRLYGVWAHTLQIISSKYY
jgi:hypothetical protein